MTSLEWLAFIINVLCVYLIVIEKDINWPIGVLGSVALALVFWRTQLYANFWLQIFYVIECLYGWYMWTRKDQSTGLKLVRIGKTKAQTARRLTFIGVLSTAALYPLFYFTSDPAPFWDTVISVVSVIAEYMLCIKLYEAWAVYFAADLASLAVLAALGYWVTFGTYLVFTFLCLLGIFAWRRSLIIYNVGLVLGKFYPLTKGHQHLIDTALTRSRKLFIAVSGRPEETIPQSLRAGWIRQLYPDPRVTVIEQPQTLPYYPSECPTEKAFYAIWTPELQRVCGGLAPDALFTSEAYGQTTARHLRCAHVMVDKRRQKFPITATMVRANPFAYWEFLDPIVRAHFVKTVCVLGPESTGKTTLCEKLATHFNTTWQPEWARAYLGNRHCAYPDMEIIARNHAAAHQSLRLHAHKILLQDTNALTTHIFSQHYYQDSPAPVRMLADESARATALFLLTDIDVPWTPDTSRDLGHPQQRQAMRDRHIAELTGRNIPFTLIQGDWDQRLKTAITAIEQLL